MLPSSLVAIVLSTIWVDHTSALPQRVLPNLPATPPTANQAEVDCYNITAGFDPTCWTSLNIPDYLNNPQTGWVSHAPACDSTTSAGRNKQGCCDKANAEPWATCYLRLGRGLPGADCSVINPTSCDWDEEQLNKSMSTWEQARARYVIWNIVQIGTFMNTYFTALQYAATNALAIVDPVTHMLDPVKKPSVKLFAILSALAVALCFLGLPAVLEGVAATVVSAAASAGMKSVQNGLKNTAQTFTLALATAPGTTRALWPQGDSASQAYQSAELDTILREAYTKIGDTIDAGLYSLMSDANQFVGFAGDGRYSGQNAVSVPQQATELGLSLATLITSESLLQNNYYANASPDPTYYYENSPSHWWYCSNQGPNIYSCKDQGYYFSNSTGRYYELKNKKHGGKDSVSILQQIAQNGWADMNALFDGAYNCTASGLAGGPPVNVKVDNSIDMSCISQLPIYVDFSKGCPAPSPNANDNCLFGDWNA